MFESIPSWIRLAIRWTSPAWYLYLVVMILAVIGMGIYLCFQDDGTDHYPEDHVRQ